MIKINYMSTLFVGIDVSSKSNVVYAMDFDENKYIDSMFVVVLYTIQARIPKSQ